MGYIGPVVIKLLQYLNCSIVKTKVFHNTFVGATMSVGFP